MSELTLLTEEQCFGDKKLEILKKRGTKARTTDFSILCNGKAYGKVEYDTYGNVISNLDKRTGTYLTRTIKDKRDSYIRGKIVAVHGDGNKTYEDNWINIGDDISDYTIRPVLTFENLETIPNNGKEPQMTSDGVWEVEYGYYPQMAPSREIQEQLEKEYNNNTLNKTGNRFKNPFWYGTGRDSGTYNEEYNYKGKKYIRVIPSEFSEEVLSNGGTYIRTHNNDGEDVINWNNVWIEVQPIKWLIDENAKIMITEKAILAGIPYIDKGTNNFENSNVKEFLYKYFAKELGLELEIVNENIQEVNKEESKIDDIQLMDEKIEDEENITAQEMAKHENIGLYIVTKYGSFENFAKDYYSNKLDEKDNELAEILYRKYINVDIKPNSINYDKLIADLGIVERLSEGNNLKFYSSKVIDRKLSDLPERERKVLEDRYALLPNTKVKTLKEIANEIGVSRERVRQIELKALRDMRKKQGWRRTFTELDWLIESDLFEEEKGTLKKLKEEIIKSDLIVKNNNFVQLADIENNQIKEGLEFVKLYLEDYENQMNVRWEKKEDFKKIEEKKEPEVQETEIEEKEEEKYIDELKLSTRANRALHSKGIYTVNNLLEHIKKEGGIKKGRGLGDKTEREIYIKLKEAGISLEEYGITLENASSTNNSNKDIEIDYKAKTEKVENKREELSELEKVRRERDEYKTKVEELETQIKEAQKLLDQYKQLMGGEGKGKKENPDLKN